jgi:hypothetical protein
MAEDELWFTESGSTKEEATAKAEAAARAHYAGKPLPERLHTRVIVGGQIDENQDLIAETGETWTVQLVYPVDDTTEPS